MTLGCSHNCEEEVGAMTHAKVKNTVVKPCWQRNAGELNVLGLHLAMLA